VTQVPPDSILGGLRVVELSSSHAASVAGLLLAEAGADVIKIEPPTGDPMRATTAFETWNRSKRSKRSVVLALATEAGRTDLNRLLAGADVLLHDLTQTEAAGFGLDDVDLGASYPELVIGSVPGYPTGHPDENRRAEELLVQARSGLMDEQMGHRDGPIAIRQPMASWAATYLLAIGVMTRLLTRERTGRGGAVQTSVYQGALGVLGMFWLRAENPIPLLIETKYDFPPSVASYECSDGRWVQIMNPGNRIDIGAIPLVQQGLAEAGHAGESVEGMTAENLRAAMRLRTCDEWLHALWEHDVAVEPALSLGESLRMPEAELNGYVVDVEDPVWGRTRQAMTPVRTDPPMRVQRPAPTVGEHTTEVLSGPSRPPRRPKGADDPRSAAPQPLAGLKVLDLGAYLAGPMAPALLGDLGADVVKIEPTTGDKLRFKPPNMEWTSRGKRSLALDVRTPQGREIIERLVRWADVVHHNRRPNSATALGVDEAGIRLLNPNAVFGYVTSYGEHGERRDWPGFDSTFVALGGWETEVAGAGNPPQFSRFGALDVQCAFASAYGTLLGLYQRTRTGRTTKVASSLLSATILTQSETLLQLDNDEIAPYPRNYNRAQVGVSPYERIYQVADGEWIAVVARSPAERAALLEVAGVDAAEDLEQAFENRRVGELVAALEDSGLGVERVRQGYRWDFFDDEDNKRTRLAVGYPHVYFGWMEQPGAMWQFGDSELALDAAAPGIGQHTKGVLAELGYTPEDVDELLAANIVVALDLGGTDERFDRQPGGHRVCDPR
jgi:crotonobetainyl-CoA:carnitine CoA-transferase CaiB-like acyl-CoA transferase